MNRRRERWPCRSLVAAAVALALGGCALGPEGTLTVVFDQPMVPEVVGQMMLRCGIHGDPVDVPSPEVWQIRPDISQKQVACLRRQPHVVEVRPAE